jgi:hypothetical protein
MTGPPLALQEYRTASAGCSSPTPKATNSASGAPKARLSTAARRAHHSDATDPVGRLAGEQCADRAAQSRGGDDEAGEAGAMQIEAREDVDPSTC